jgi:hypothetical protein
MINKQKIIVEKFICFETESVLCKVNFSNEIAKSTSNSIAREYPVVLLQKLVNGLSIMSEHFRGLKWFDVEVIAPCCAKG